jgi:hypothetical protein
LNTIQKGHERKEKILLSLDRLGFASRSQLQRIHELGSDRNACRVLKNMDEYFNTFRLEETIFYLNKNGRDMIGSNIIRTKTNQIRHILMRNELYIFFGCPQIWSVEEDVKINDKIYVRPDVRFKTDRMYFAEIDNVQRMNVNIKKIEKYAELKSTNAFQKQFGYFPQLVWLTKTEHRKRRLVSLCREKQLSNFVATLDDVR